MLILVTATISPRLAHARERGDADEVEAIVLVFEDWERDQGQTRDRLACAVCGDAWLTPTGRGTSRPHARRDAESSSLDRVRQLRKDIQTLETELDRQLSALEPDEVMGS